MALTSKEQFRAARRLLGISQIELARRYGLPISAVKAVEQGKGTLCTTHFAVENALKSAGIVFLKPGEECVGAAGVCVQ
jgi:predicted transcriptional regulator